MNDILELFKIAGRIDLDGVDKANRDLDNLDGKGKSTASKIGGFAKKIGKGAAIIGGAAVAAGGAAFAMTQKVTDSFDNIAKTSHKLGITTDAYQVLDYWAGQNGVSTASMERAVGRLNQRMGAAAAGNEKYTDALTALGVNMNDVKKGTISTEDALKQAIGTLMKMENSQEKSALASELFGTKLARDLMPALDEGSLSIEDATKAAEELGFVIDNDTLSAAEHFNDTWDNLTRAVGAFGQKLLAQLMPAFQTMMDWALKHLPTIQKVFGLVFDSIVKVISTALSWFQKLLAILNDWFDFSDSKMSELADLYQRYMSMIWGYVQEAFQFIGTILETAFATISPFVQEQLAKLQGFWIENGEQIMQAVQNVFEFIKAVIEFIMPVILFIVQDIWENIKHVISGALDVIMGVVKAFSSLFTGDWSGLWEGIKQILSGALQALWGLINLWFIGKIFKVGKTFARGFTNIFKSLWNGIKSLFSSSVNFVKNIVQSGFNLMRSVVSSIMNGIRSVITGAWNGIRSVTSSAVNGIRSVVTSVFNGIRSVTTSIWNGIKTAITTPINAAKNTVKGALDAIKGFFSGLKLKFPKIKMPKLPKFSLKGKFSLAPPQVPKLGISWHAKGGIFKEPTIFDTKSGLHGVGEAGPEAILPLNNNTLGTIGSMIARTMPKSNETTATTVNNENNITVHAVIRDEQDINKLTNKLDETLSDLGRRREAAWGG